MQKKQPTFTPTGEQAKHISAVREDVNALASLELSIVADGAKDLWGHTVKAMRAGVPGDALKVLAGYKDLPINTKASFRKCISTVDRAESLGVALFNGNNAVRGKSAVEDDCRKAEGTDDKTREPRSPKGENEETGIGTPEPTKAERIRALLAELATDAGLRAEVANAFENVAKAYSMDRATPPKAQPVKITKAERNAEIRALIEAQAVQAGGALATAEAHEAAMAH